MSIDLVSGTLALQQCTLFKGLDDAMIGSLLSHARTVSLNDSDTLFAQNDRSQHVFYLETGQIKLSRISLMGQEKVVELISPGQSFAEAVMFSGVSTYPVTATSLGSSVVWAFDADHFKRLLSRSSDACLNIMAELSRRLHQLVTDIDHLTLHSASDRLVYWLLDNVSDVNCGQTEVQLDVQKQVLASRLSVTPETLSRTLSNLQKLGLIVLQGERVRIDRVEALREHARRTWR
jgi:CRP-like cAMP-binding protein